MSDALTAAGAFSGHVRMVAVGGQVAAVAWISIYALKQVEASRHPILVLFSLFSGAVAMAWQTRGLKPAPESRIKTGPREQQALMAWLSRLDPRLQQFFILSSAWPTGDVVRAMGVTQSTGGVYRMRLKNALTQLPADPKLVNDEDPVRMEDALALYRASTGALPAAHSAEAMLESIIPISQEAFRAQKYGDTIECALPRLIMAKTTDLLEALSLAPSTLKAGFILRSHWTPERVKDFLSLSANTIYGQRKRVLEHLRSRGLYLNFEDALGLYRRAEGHWLSSHPGYARLLKYLSVTDTEGILRRSILSGIALQWPLEEIARALGITSGNVVYRTAVMIDTLNEKGERLETFARRMPTMISGPEQPIRLEATAA